MRVAVFWYHASLPRPQNRTQDDQDGQDRVPEPWVEPNGNA